MPPDGYKFTVTKADAGRQSFFSTPRWFTGVSDMASHFAVGSVTFENLQGTPPNETYGLDYVSNAGQGMTTWHQFDVVGDFEFTAMRVEFTVTHDLARTSRTYGEVSSYALPSFGSSLVFAGSGGPDASLMQIVPVEP